MLRLLRILRMVGSMVAVARRLPTPSDVDQADRALRAFAAMPRGQRDDPVRLQPERAEGIGVVTVPREAFDLLLEILGQMANGNAVTVVPVHAELTTQQAADLLNVSRPHLIGLLDEGKIPFRHVGSHRRVKFVDVMAFKEADERQRRSVLDELTADAQADGLGY